MVEKVDIASGSTLTLSQSHMANAMLSIVSQTEDQNWTSLGTDLIGNDQVIFESLLQTKLP